MPIENRTERSDTRSAGRTVKSIAEYVWLHQVALVSLVDGAFESRPGQNGGQIEKDVDGIDNRQSVNPGCVPLEIRRRYI